ncbi:MAG: threonine aldolase family protein [Janthinobacterium lividum]
MAHALDRRSFLLGAGPAALGVATLAGTDAFAQTYARAAAPTASAPMTDRTVFLAGDAAPVSQASYLAVLTRAMQKHDLSADNYLKGGAVTELEEKFAGMLGKEDCCFLPTGTLANNLAVRLLCGEHKHAMTQADSHLYADESDAASIMSGITLQPLTPGKAAPTFDEFAAAIADAEGRAYPLKVGAISIESPVRRHDGESVPFATIEKVCTLAKSKGIAMHWDGARAFMLTGTPGFDLKRTASQFDTVYLSLYKALRAPFGAVLAGPKPIVAQARDLRHVFGGLIYHGWVAALPALDALDGFEDRFTRARAVAEQVLAKLQAGGYGIQRVPNESNIVYVKPTTAQAAGLADRLAKADVRARLTKDGFVPFFINDTLLHQTAGSIAAAFLG